MAFFTNFYSFQNKIWFLNFLNQQRETMPQLVVLSKQPQSSIIVAVIVNSSSKFQHFVLHWFSCLQTQLDPIFGNVKHVCATIFMLHQYVWGHLSYNYKCVMHFITIMFNTMNHMSHLTCHMHINMYQAIRCTCRIALHWSHVFCHMFANASCQVCCTRTCFVMC